eukprot:9483827-Pyramimonas_sp.AAC.1
MGLPKNPGTHAAPFSTTLFRIVRFLGGAAFRGAVRIICQVGKIAKGMISTQKAGTVKFKGGETSDILPFIIETLRNHFGLIMPTLTNKHALLRAGESLIAWKQAFKGRGRFADQETCDELVRLGQTHLTEAKNARVKLFPKHHAFKHLNRSVWSKGSPNHYATWLDESLNSVLSSIAGSIHKRAMERKSFQKFDLLMSGHLGLII